MLLRLWAIWTSQNLKHGTSGSIVQVSQPYTYYCVANFTSLPLPSTVATLPSPVQSGIISSCTSWYQATFGDDCTLIPSYFETFTQADLLSWNPALKSDCSGLVPGDYYCVAIPGTPTTPTTTASITPLPTNGVGPQPEQPGIPSTCSIYWFVGEYVLL